MRRWLPVFLAAALLAALAAVLVTASARDDPDVALAAPLAPDLRVPLGALLLAGSPSPLRPGDLVLGVAPPGQGGFYYPRDREELWRLTAELDPGARLRVDVARGGERLEKEVQLVRTSLASRATENWPLLLVGLAFLGFGAIVLARSSHPVAAPIFALSTSSGVVLLAALEPALAWTPEAATVREVWSRAGLLAHAMVPASLLHLAMRFPVVAERFRATRMAVLPYLFWLGPAAYGQVRFHDGRAIHSLDWLCAGAGLLFVGVLLVASRAHREGLSPIERHRARALLWGLAAAIGAVATLSLLRVYADATAGHVAVLGLLAFPASLGWAIVRYRLLEPPAWLLRLLVFAMTAALSIALVAGILIAGVGAFGGWARWSLGGMLVLAVLVVTAYQIVHAGLHRAARRRLLPATASEELATRAIERLHASPSREAVLAEAAELLREGLDASQVVAGMPDAEDDRAASLLLCRGLALWRRAGSPSHRLVLAGARSEDPAPNRPELVIPLQTPAAPPALLVVASRPDGLPYTPEEVRTVETIGHVATVALGSAANAAELARLVSERTRSLEQALDDRAGVLAAARAICEADAPDAVIEAVESFARNCIDSDHGMDVPLGTSAEEHTVTSYLRLGDGAKREVRVLAPAADRAHEIQPQLDTVCLFGSLAITRLSLLRELKNEVERQAREIAEARSRRVHAEFVRNVAHELRKPVEEVSVLCRELGPGVVAPDRFARLRAVSGELSRRLDLMLFHSGIRLERRRVELSGLIDEAVHRFQTVNPKRVYRTRHATRPLPLVGDASRLLSVLENLIDNAVKATPDGGRVAVRSWLESKEERRQIQGIACFEVEDDGEGVRPDRQARIFAPGISFRDNGFGLGLALCRAIVLRHGGTLEVESEPGCTIFRVCLPQFASGTKMEEKL